MAGGLGRQLAELPLLVVLLGAVALSAWLPAAHATILRDAPTAQAFFYGGLILLVLTVMLGLATHHRILRHPAQAQLASVAGAYLILPLAMALPLRVAVPDTTWVNAWFEMLSTFSTTGASVYEPGRLPPSVHLWRALTGWFGGFFILLVAWSILAPLNLGGAEVWSGHVPGRGPGMPGQSQRPAEAGLRLQRQALDLLPVYAALTLALWLLLLIAGEDGLLALTHAMGTLSTSGISAGIGMSVTGSGLPGEVLVFLFLCLALSRRLMPMPGRARMEEPLWRDPELRLAFVVVALVVAALLLRHLMSEAKAQETETLGGLIRAFWGATFTTVSFLTTTGYESAWWSSARAWAGLGAPGMVLLGLAILGGGVATTAGGVKLLRVYALFLQGQRELERIVHPNSVGGKGAFRRRLAREGAYMAWVFFMLFAMSLALVTVALNLAGLAFEPALVLGVAALTTTGNLAQVAVAEPVSYGAQSTAVKLILGVAMVVGRLEVLALVALIVPESWRQWKR